MTGVLANKPRILSHFPNVVYHAVGIAASQGGISALKTLLSALPSDFPAAITVVQHTSPDYPSYLVSILSRCTPLRVKQAQTGEVLRPETVYIAVPGKHLLVNPDGMLALSDTPKVNFVRPAADKLFRSLATSYQRRAIAVVLTGRNSDGTLGAVTIKKHGGTVIAQDQATCKYFSMPQAAVETGKVDWVPAILILTKRYASSENAGIVMTSEKAKRARTVERAGFV
jgi:two-component system chemotaxis response regulator CheB